MLYRPRKAVFISILFNSRSAHWKSETHLWEGIAEMEWREEDHRSADGQEYIRRQERFEAYKWPSWKRKISKIPLATIEGRYASDSPILSLFSPITKLPIKKRVHPIIELFFGPILSSMMPIGRAATLLTTTEIVKARLSWRERRKVRWYPCKHGWARKSSPASPALYKLFQCVLIDQRLHHCRIDRNRHLLWRVHFWEQRSLFPDIPKAAQGSCH